MQLNQVTNRCRNTSIFICQNIFYEKENTSISSLLMISTLFGCSTSDDQVDQTMTYHLDEEELSDVVSNVKVGVLAGRSDELCMSELYSDSKTYPFSTNSDILAAVGASKVWYGMNFEAQAIFYLMRGLNPYMEM